MGQIINGKRVRTCPQCDKHCPVNALQCGRGRKYFGVADAEREQEHGCSHRRLDGLAGLLHQCGRFVRHAGMGEEELFQVLTAEEKASFQSLLEKLSESWRIRFGEESLNCGHHGHGCEDRGHRYEGHDR